MKVLYLVPQPKLADRIGAYTFLDEEIQALATAGIEAYVLSTKIETNTIYGRVRMKAARRPSDIRSQVAAFALRRHKEVPVRHFFAPTLLHHVARLEYEAATIVETEKIDLIHSHFAWPDGFGGLLARAESGRPLIATLRGTDILRDDEIAYGRRSSRTYDQALRRLLATADRTVYFSNFMREQALALGATPDLACVVRKGVDLSHFRVAEDRLSLRRNLGFDGPVILTVAGLIRRKGIHHIIEALGCLDPLRAFTLLVIGEGPERERLEALCAACGIASRTRFLGQVGRQAIPKYFAACDIFILASTVEAAGNVLFEAMASGRPVICTDSGGPAEYVSDGETGFVVPASDPRAMAKRIEELLDNPRLQDCLGSEGRSRTVGLFDYDRMVKDIIGIYEEMLGTTTYRQATA